MKYESGNIYEGQLLNGKRSGKGKMTFTNGDKYMGMWKSDQMCDHDGIYSFKNGNEYRGSLKTAPGSKYGMIEGKGSLKIPGVGTYTGSFANGMVSGPGKFDFIDGQKPIDKHWPPISLEDFAKQFDK